MEPSERQLSEAPVTVTVSLPAPLPLLSQLDFQVVPSILFSAHDRVLRSAPEKVVAITLSPTEDRSLSCTDTLDRVLATVELAPRRMPPNLASRMVLPVISMPPTDSQLRAKPLFH